MNMKLEQETISTGIRTEAGFEGFLMRWLICGPFNRDGSLSSCEALERDVLVEAGGESGVRPRAGKRVSAAGPSWKRCDARYGFKIDLLRDNPGANVIAYAAAYLNCPSSRPVRMGVG